ncbi:type II toxin-antitoxin system HipA family toxin [Agromyces albus]|uniref:Type II toxin-antitoxin system HipA family toxin n=1 Tax=Agromyces albus TaxID=205332 RepID=A0A4Q2L7J4_9MICO|nr:HipA domain-containing protein [Agromyces albus]RXZ72281.1 type II toxin-antitoxin system HipA family toxin [Agromyces albus]
MTVDLERLRFTSAADVYKAGVLAARIERRADGSTSFRYLDDYLRASPDRSPAEPIATSLPMTDREVVSPAGALPPFFAGLLPEGHRLSVLRRAVKTSADDELSLLLAVGEDVPGDVQVVVEGEAPADPAPLAGADEAGTLDFSALVDEVDRHAIPGVQRKASASMISTPLATRQGRYILKLSPAEYPLLVQNEAAHLAGAKALKLPVAKSALVADRHDVAGLLVERFDRMPLPDGSWRRLALEDATQVLAVPPASKYSVPAERVVTALASVASAPVVASRNLYLQFVFAWLTGNGDLHAKNVSVIRGAGAGWTVAPVYDVACTLVYGDTSMALPIDGRTTRLRARHWQAFADAIGLPERAARSAEALALNAASTVRLDAIGFTGSPLNGAVRELRMRRAELAR